MVQLLTIGEFVVRCGLSRSALRFYDQNDLLRPRLVDGETGYRYYAIEQIAQAALVRALRAAEMPVGTVRRYLLASADERRAVLDAHLVSFRDRATAVESAVEKPRRGLDDAAGELGARYCSVAPTHFAEALAQVSFAIADPGVRAEPGAVWVETREDSLRLVATDSYRLAVRDLVPEQIGADGLRGVIDAEQAVALTAVLSDACTFMLPQDPDGMLTATVDGHATTVGHAGEGFPDYERVLMGLPTGRHAALARADLMRALGRLPADASHVCLELEPEQIALQALDRRVTVASGWSGSSLRMCVDPRFFTEAVDATVGPDLVIQVSDPLQPLMLRSADRGPSASSRCRSGHRTRDEHPDS